MRCRAFAITLEGLALAWFNRLLPASISSFKELSIAFVSHFIGARTYRKSSYHLLIVKQGSQENLRSYVQRFNSESLRVDILDEKFAITAFIAGLGIQSKDLMFSISNNEVSMAEELAKAEKYINGEEALMSKQGSSSARKEKSKDDKKRDRSPRRRRDRDRSPQRGREDRDRSQKRRGNRRGNVRNRLGPPQPELQPRYPPQQFTPLTTSVSQVLYEVQHEKILRWPSQMKKNPTKRDMAKYCDFHRDHGHRIDDCIKLKKEIKFLIRRGHFRRYVAPKDRNRAPPPSPH